MLNEIKIPEKIITNKKNKYKSRVLNKIWSVFKFEKNNLIWFYNLVKNNWQLISKKEKQINWTNYILTKNLFSKWYTIKNKFEKDKWIFYNYIWISNYILTINWYWKINSIIIKEKKQIKNQLKITKITFYFIDENTNEKIIISFSF